jgi:hypothetical protein
LEDVGMPVAKFLVAFRRPLGDVQFLREITSPWVRSVVTVCWVVTNDSSEIYHTDGAVLNVNPHIHYTRMLRFV